LSDTHSSGPESTLQSKGSDFKRGSAVVLYLLSRADGFYAGAREPPNAAKFAEPLRIVNINVATQCFSCHY